MRRRLESELGQTSLTALTRRVQRFVGLDEQEAIGATDGHRLVLIDPVGLHMENHMSHTVVQLVWVQL